MGISWINKGSEINLGFYEMLFRPQLFKRWIALLSG